MNKILTKRVSFALLVIWLIIIFIFSSMSGVKSSNLSRVILSSVTNNVVKRTDVFDLLHLLLRKSAHICEYIILSALAYSYFKYYIDRNNLLYISILIFVAVCSIIDEYHQLFISGRTGKLIDVLIDIAGAIIFLVFIIIRKKNVASRKSN